MASVRLTPAAREWVQQRGGVVTLRAAPQHGCCGGTALIPMAEPRVPDDSAGFEVQADEGVTVYRAVSLDRGPYQVDLEGFLGWKRLVVEGLVSPAGSR